MSLSTSWEHVLSISQKGIISHQSTHCLFLSNTQHLHHVYPVRCSFPGRCSGARWRCFGFGRLSPSCCDYFCANVELWPYFWPSYANSFYVCYFIAALIIVRLYCWAAWSCATAPRTSSSATMVTAASHKSSRSFWGPLPSRKATDSAMELLCLSPAILLVGSKVPCWALWYKAGHIFLAVASTAGPRPASACSSSPPPTQSHLPYLPHSLPQPPKVAPLHSRSTCRQAVTHPFPSGTEPSTDWCWSSKSSRDSSRGANAFTVYLQQPEPALRQHQRCWYK